MNVSTLIILIILIAILIPAIRSTVTHLKGEGACCGGPKEKAPKKKIKGTPVKELTIHIDGMHCVNCKNRIERKLDELDGVVAKVNLDKKLAEVSLYKEIDPETIKNIIEGLDFTVTGMD